MLGDLSGTVEKKSNCQSERGEAQFILFFKFQDLDGCNYFTHYDSLSQCYSWTECVGFSTDTCTDCISGDISCGDCGSEGVCDGTVLMYTDDKSASACAYKCGITNHCQWYSFDGVTASCTLTSDCSKVVDCDLCVHGEKRCGYPNEGKRSFQELHKTIDFLVKMFQV